MSYAIVFTLIILFTCNAWIKQNTKSQIYNSVADCPNNKCGLLLGTSKKGRFGGQNLFFNYRIKAAADLFKAGKIKNIIVSGDNSVKDYDEANDMRQALVEQGVPDSCIYLDYAGFRTLDSVVRCDKIFSQTEFTIISQEFHNQRALFIANKLGYKCVAFNAQDVPKRFSPKTYLREYFARVKCVLDIYILHTQPKFLGDKVVVK